MNLTGWMGSAAVIGIIAAFWDKIKFAYARIVALLIVTANIDDDLATGCLVIFNKRFRRSPYGPQTFSSYWRYVRPVKAYREVAYEQFYNSEPTLYWSGWRPIVVQETGGKNGASDISRSRSLTIKFIRGTWNINKFIEESMACYNELWSNVIEDCKNNLRRFFIHKFVGAGKKTGVGENTIMGYRYRSNNVMDDATVKFVGVSMEEIGIETFADSEVNSLALPDELLAIIQEIKLWRERKDWYKERNIPWRRGWLLWGKPGNGKTSLVRAIAMDMNMPIFSFDLASMSNMEMIQAWKQAQQYSPCIALFEDIDSVFNKRENIVGEQGGGLTFDCLLNCLNGAEDNDGIFTVITTNLMDKLDDAIAKPPEKEGMASRPGRVDRIIEIRNPDTGCRRKIAGRILTDWPDDVERVVSEGDGDSSAQFQERCVQLALNKVW